MYPRLRLPYTLNGLSDTDIVRLELVQTQADGEGGGVQAPPEQLAQAGVRAVGNVVDDDLLEAHVGVQQDAAAEDGVHGGVQGAGSEGSDGERDETEGKAALEDPVVGALGGVGLGNGGGIVD